MFWAIAPISPAPSPTLSLRTLRSLAAPAERAGILAAALMGLVGPPRRKGQTRRYREPLGTFTSGSWKNDHSLGEPRHLGDAVTDDDDGLIQADQSSRNHELPHVSVIVELMASCFAEATAHPLNLRERRASRYNCNDSNSPRDCSFIPGRFIDQF
jgi:hypothetical protein